MDFIVVGCGRFGSELAYHLFQNGHQVVVVIITSNPLTACIQTFAGVP